MSPYQTNIVIDLRFTTLITSPSRNQTSQNLSKIISFLLNLPSFLTLERSVQLSCNSNPSSFYAKFFFPKQGIKTCIYTHPKFSLSKIKKISQNSDLQSILLSTMAKKLLSASLSLFILFSSTITNTYSTSFTLTNNCPYTIWPGTLTNSDKPRLSSSGFALNQSETITLDAPPSWGGRFWARTHCSTDPAGRFTCASGDCGSGTMECSGNGATPPATLAEFTLNGNAGLDFYDVSLVDGYNLPMQVVPQGSGGCNTTGCPADLNRICPPELSVLGADGGSKVIACKSACAAFGTAEYCCSGASASPKTCGPSTYSKLFKNSCPKAYSYAYDDLTSTFTCAGASNYLITFCPDNLR